MTQAETTQPTAADPFRYSYAIDRQSDSTAARVVRLVGSGKRVLELGCAAGHMSRVLIEQGCQVVGVELDPTLAAEAAHVCERVIVGDLDQLDLAAELVDDQFDVVVAADVLEHLRDPLAVLTIAKRYLRPNGCLVISLPNIAHGSVRLALLGGQFPYADLGLLDRSHLHFYTRASMEALLADAGLAISHLERVLGGIVGAEIPWDSAAAPPDLVKSLEADVEARTYQFIVVAYPLPVAQLHYFREQMNLMVMGRDMAEQSVRLMSDELTAIRARVEELLQHNTALEEANSALSASVDRLAEAQLSLTAERDRLASDLATAQQELDGLRTQVAFIAYHETEMNDQLLEARDKIIRLEGEQVKQADMLRAAYQDIQWMRSSRSWQLIEKSWDLRKRLRGERSP